MASKSRFALQYNIELLFGGSESVYFWTFTLPIKLHPKEGAAMWSDMLRELKRSLGFWGVRVFELHPGGHGLHVHCATGQRFDVHQVRRVCRRFGWGRLHVEVWDKSDAEKAGAYMAKYLGKQIKVWGGLKGMRWWGVFGKTTERVRVADIEIKSLRRQIWDMLPAWVVCGLMGCGDVDQGRVRQFNMAKMWVVNKIYFRSKNLFESCGKRFGKFGVTAEILQYDFDELLRGAVFLSGCKVGGV